MENFLNRSRLALLSIVLMLVSCGALVQSRNKSPVVGRIIEYTSDASGFNTKTIFYETQHEVIAFDAQFTDKHALDAIKHLRTFTQKPITWLIITHPNPDKFNGATVFQKHGAKIIASNLTKNNIPQVHAYKKYYFVNMAKMFTEKSYPSMPHIDRTFDKELILTLKNGEDLTLREYGQSGISLNQTVALLPKHKSLIVGDLVHYNAHAWLEGGIINSSPTPTIKEWINLLNKIQADYDKEHMVYGGRGDVAPIGFVLPKQVAYLKKAEKLVDDYLKKLGSKVSELKTDKAQEHYLALSSIFQREFPTYKLPYMIQYGIYGLINSKI